MTKKAKQGEELIFRPEQERSRLTMDKIMNAMEDLLKEKTYDEITMQEVAVRSETGISSIYARFRDKQALVLGIHSRLSKQTLTCLEELTEEDRWKNHSTAEIVASVVPHCVKYYRMHDALMKAALRINLPVMRERQADALNFATERFCALLAPRYPGQSAKLKFAVGGGVQMLASLMYTSFLFHEIKNKKSRIADDKANIRLLTSAITALIESSLSE